MNNTITDNIRRIRNILDHSEKVIAETDALSRTLHIRDLVEKLQAIDDYYKNCCDETDYECGETPGTTYEEGTSIEFYIESSDWHEVSLILRELKKQNGDN